MTEPRDLPSKEDVRRSGMGDWVNRAVSEQEKKNRELASLLDGASEELERQKRDLQDLMNAPPEGSVPVEEEEPAPDLFASEREEQARARRNLAGFAEEERRRKEKERDALRDLFGS